MDLVKLHMSEDNPFRHPARTGNLGSLIADVIFKKKERERVLKTVSLKERNTKSLEAE